MRTLAVEFAPESPWRGRVLNLMLMVSVFCAAGASWHAWADWEKLKTARREVQELQAKLSAREQQAREQAALLARPKPYAKDVAEIVRVASFPTGQVLSALENTQIEGVRVTSIDLNPETATAKVELEFFDQVQLMKYLEEINAGEEKSRWVLLQAKMQKGLVGNKATLMSNWSDMRQF